MCGPENTLRPRGGALAVLHSSQAKDANFNADLYLLTPGKPASDQATRAVLTSTTLLGFPQMHVFVSTTGDLTRKIEDCESLCQFSFDEMSSSNSEVGFNKPLSLQIGNEGIMGRRVSLCSSPTLSSENIIAEGIVGHNFFSPDQQARHSQPPF